MIKKSKFDCFDCSKKEYWFAIILNFFLYGSLTVVVSRIAGIDWSSLPFYIRASVGIPIWFVFQYSIYNAIIRIKKLKNKK